jgi:alanine racemase
MSGSGHRVWAEIDLSALRRNMARVLSCLQPEARVLAVVKADAYGHGAVPVARALSDQPGLWGFGVGDSQEALELRAAGILAPILILGTIIREEEAQVVSHDVRVCVHSMERFATLEDESRRQGRRTRVHVMVDTGMGRLGALPARSSELARAVAASRWLELEGVASHMSAGRPGHPFTGVQRDRLLSVLADLESDHIRPPLVHFANTAAILGGEGCNQPLVRPGISLYGVLGPDLQHRANALGLEAVMSLRTQIVYMKDVPAGTPIGYNGTHVTARATRVATLPIGYNDGLAYRLSNRGRALLKGACAPIIGSISMDYTMLDVGHIDGARVGDTVTLIGRDGGQSIGIPELASIVGTIPYEISCSVGKRVHRLYVREDLPLPGAAAVDDEPVAARSAVASAAAAMGAGAAAAAAASASTTAARPAAAEASARAVPAEVAPHAARSRRRRTPRPDDRGAADGGATPGVHAA